MMEEQGCHIIGYQPGGFHEQVLEKVVLKGQALIASTADIVLTERCAFPFDPGRIVAAGQ